MFNLIEIENHKIVTVNQQYIIKEVLISSIRKLIKVEGIHDLDSWEIYIEGQCINLDDSIKHVNHSPDGFSWGYGGSGPSQTSFAILLEVLGLRIAKYHYMEFKNYVISKLEPHKDFCFYIDLAVWPLLIQHLKRDT